jgi:hypothetical protein
MGSDLYASVERQYPNGYWSTVTNYQTSALARGVVVCAFGDCDPDAPMGKAGGYLTHAEWVAMQDHEKCPWRLDEPYWVRLVPGEEFVTTVREKRWQRLQDGDYHDEECSPELRAVAAMVESFLVEGVPVRVWCWHSQ